MIPAPPTKADGKELDCSATDGKFDAVLLSSISPGYSMDGGAAEPRVAANIRLVSSNCKNVMMVDVITYSAQPVAKFTHIPRDSKYKFATRELLIASPDTSREAMRAGVTEIAKKLLDEF